MYHSPIKMFHAFSLTNREFTVSAHANLAIIPVLVLAEVFFPFSFTWPAHFQYIFLYLTHFDHNLTQNCLYSHSKAKI